MLSSALPARLTSDWVLLAYRLPREPSTPRIALWRRLRRLGAAQLLDGLVALPLTPETREQLEWAAEEVLEAGGDASIWIAAPATRAQERALAGLMTEALAADYAAVVDAANKAASRTKPASRRTVQQLRRTLRAIDARDHFHPPARELARRAVEDLAQRVEVAG
jgi:broad specificity phosphatase PhoE